MMKILKPCTWTKVVCCLLVACCCLLGVTRACGAITHIEISHQALENYEDIQEDVDYGQIASLHQDALEAGSAYPDAFYPPTCFFGRFNDVSEDTHWTQFLNASIVYINSKYPKPWNTDIQKLVAFLLGVVSHQVADVLWHSLGIDQGFIQTMAKMNFHDVYSDAHPVADTGGDVLNVYQLNLDYSALFGDWYVPVNHLANIYQEMYGTDRVNRIVIRTCSEMLYLYKIAARLAAGSFFGSFAEKSPFLVDQLYSYFQGGITDMAAWTRRIWKEYTTALENNLGNCHLPRNSLFIRCNATDEFTKNYKESSLKNGFYAKMDIGDLSIDDIIVEETEGGVYLRSGERLKARKQSKDNSLRFESESDIKWKAIEREEKLKALPTSPNHVFTTDKPYAQLGSAFAVGDLNGDGFDDLVVGSAGVYPSGIVYVIYGSDEGIFSGQNDIEQAADVTIHMPVDDHSLSSLFGASLATFDLDQDGQLELAVGAPAYKAVDLLYQGRVFIFSINSSSTNNASVRATVDCVEKFCNFGYTLHADNTTGLGLVMGAPFAAAGGAQRGAIAFLPSNTQYTDLENLQFFAQVSEVESVLETEAMVLNIIRGEIDYGWRGYSLDSATIDNTPNVMFGEPGFRDCVNSSCEYSPGDSQTVGEVIRGVMEGGEFDPITRISRKLQFLQLGAQVALGQPLLSRPNYFAASGPSSDVAAQIFSLDFTLDQAGVVYFVTDFAAVTAFVNGDRSFGRFGNVVKFSDLTNDGLDELIIGAPLWTRFLNYGVQEGRVYIYGGGKFPLESHMSGDCAGSSLISPCPEKRAYKVLTFGESLARFGTQAISLKSTNKTSLFVTAAHSSRSGRLAGAIGVFDFHH
ncbi:hypothetical protein RRG08_023483 [Elysia crispata]|uniref:Phosphatidylinositol-glycan-specific phospholipase D n=1 Tax=Elysia crispata TaxID=231223 RepID=A0AAE0YYC2_9GAST|nr:hypothetical protein RRG08_023483 [Elysia crispata]